MGDLTADFSAWEFECPVSGESLMNPRTIGRLQRLRTLYGRPITIVEHGGYRSPANPNGSEKSAHRVGKAVDLGVPNTDYYRIIQLAIDCGFTGIFVKNKGGRFQIHLDDAPQIEGRPRPWIGTY